MNGLECFLVDMGPRSRGHSLDRINNDGDYEPSNCRWANATQQSRNQRTTLFVEVRGQKIPFAEAVESYGKVGYRLAFHRIFTYGWSAEDALTTPLKPRAKRGEGKDYDARHRRYLSRTAKLQ